MIVGFKAMAEYLAKHAGFTLHPDTLRKAVDDTRNPLPVVYEQGVAHIEPLALMRWREGRKGVRIHKRTA